MPFRFFNALYFAKFTLEEIHNKFTFTVGFMKYFIRFTRGYGLDPIRSFKFRLLLYDTTGGSGKCVLMSGFMCKIFQFDLKILIIGGRVGLNVVTNGMRV